MTKARGRRPPAENVPPTPEVLARRALLAGPEGDPDKTSTLLDLLQTRDVVSDRQWRACRRYVYARRMLYGQASARAISERWEGLPPGEHIVGDAAYRRALDDFNTLAAALGDMKRQVDAVIVYEITPHWFKLELGLVARQRAGDERQRERFVEGVEQLTLAYEAARVMREAA